MAQQIDIRTGGVSLDLQKGEDQKFYITRQVNDILKGLDTRQGDYTKQVQLPTTIKNIQALNITPYVTIDPQPNNYILCQVIFNGIPVLPDAKLVVVSGDNDFIKINIFSGNSDFFAQLREEPLAALDLSAYNFTWDFAGYASRAGTGIESGVLCPDNPAVSNLDYKRAAEKGLIDSEIPTRYVNLQMGGFWFYVHTLFEEIFNRFYGLTVDYSKLDYNFNTLVTWCPLPQFIEAYDNPEGYKASGTRLSTDPELPLENNGETILIPLNFTDPDGLWVTDRYIIQETGLCKIYIDILGQYADGDFCLGCNPVLEIWTGYSGKVYSQAMDLEWPSFMSKTLIFSVNIPIVDGVANQVWAILRGNNPSPAIYDLDNLTFNVQSGNSASRDLTVAGAMPLLSQKEFVKQIMTMYNIVPIEKDRVIYLLYWDDLINNPPVLVKNFENKSQRISTLLPGYGRSNICKFASNDLIERLDNFSSFPVNSDILPDTVVKIEIDFTQPDVYAGTADPTPGQSADRVSPPSYGLYYEKVDNNKIAISGLEYSTTEANDLQPGNLILAGGTLYQVDLVLNNKEGTLKNANGNQQGQDWEFAQFESLVSYDEMYIGRAVLFGGLARPVYDGDLTQDIQTNWSVISSLTFEGLLNTYFVRLQRTLASPVIVDVLLELKTLEYFEIDLTAPIYIEKMAANFYINKIEQYKLKGLVKFNLIKVQ